MEKPGFPSRESACRPEYPADSPLTEQKKLEEALQASEQLFRTLCDSAPIGIFRTDCQGNNFYCNPRWVEITGMPAEESKGMGWFETIHPEDREEILKAWIEATSEGRVYNDEHRLLTRQGKSVWVRALANPIKDPDGTIAGYVGTVEDITERRLAGQDLLKTQKLESLGVLAGGIAHDFNNILTAILGNISFALLHVYDPHKVTKRLVEAENATARARELTHQLLTFACGGEPVKQVIDVPPLLHEAAEMTLLGSNVSCEFAIPDDVWPLEADEGQLTQVIHNLVLNAAQAMPEGGLVTITAENVTARQSGKRFVRISVADIGTGIPEHHLLRIFDPYFTTKRQGSGLGLATCYSIIRKHGGKIRAKSTVGMGSTFEIALPALQREQTAEPASSAGVVRGSGHVLVMDDEEIIRSLLQEILTDIGYTVECVSNGSDAVELYRRRKEEGRPFSAVILDLTIAGGMGGKETISRLLSQDPEVKAIVTSGYSSDPVMANYRDYGFKAVILKPYRPQEMSKILQELHTV